MSWALSPRPVCLVVLAVVAVPTSNTVIDGNGARSGIGTPLIIEERASAIASSETLPLVPSDLDTGRAGSLPLQAIDFGASALQLLRKVHCFAFVSRHRFTCSSLRSP